jgi:hypothetical protein
VKSFASRTVKKIRHPAQRDLRNERKWFFYEDGLCRNEDSA